MKYYSVIKKNEIVLFAGKWMDLEIIRLSKVSQVQKDQITLFPSYVETIPKRSMYK
jgi:hypothetical protein